MPTVSPDDPAYVGQVFRDWRRLTHKQRRDVRQLARSGRIHPDAAVAAVAHRWAVVVSEDNLAWWDYLWFAPLAAFDFVAGLWTGGGLSYPERRRKDAERLLRAEQDAGRSG